MNNGLSTKNILIVGAGGIGKATFDILREKPFRLIIADHQPERLSDFPGMTTIALDICDPVSRQEAIRRIKQDVGSLDAVIITAAKHSTYPIEHLPDRVIDAVLDVNLVSHIKLVRDLLPIIADGGRIIGISSIAAGIGVPMSSLYSASKAGMELFYESLAAETSYRKIKSILIHPGNVNTGFNETGNDYHPQNQGFIDTSYKKVLSRINSRYGIPAAHVARVIVTALTTPKPKLCYIVGLNALKAFWCKRLLGRDLTLSIMKKFFGLS